jgi:hypothetical protein
LNGRLYIVEAILAAICLSSCAKDPFSTRGTNPPVGSGGTWETPQSPEVTVRNLLFACNERVITNYERCFSDSFLFSAPEDSIDAVNGGNPDLFADWNRAAELATAANIFTSFSGTDTMGLFLTLSPSPDRTDIVEDSSAILFRNYSLRIIVGQPGIADTMIATGMATFHLLEEQLNWWTVNWWEDRPAEAGKYDWGDFKAEYRR